MSELKTKPTKASVSAFIDAIEDPQKRKDCRELVKMMSEVTGKKPKMWGEQTIVWGW